MKPHHLAISFSSVKRLEEVEHFIGENGVVFLPFVFRLPLHPLSVASQRPSLLVRLIAPNSGEERLFGLRQGGKDEGTAVHPLKKVWNKERTIDYFTRTV